MLPGNPVVIQGFEIPSDNSFFLTILAIHVLAAFTCVVSGVIAMLSEKQFGRHPKAGTIYFWSLLIVFMTATMMAILRWKEDYYLFILGFFAFTSALIGRRARRKLWVKWSIIHITAMGISYIFLLIAFYMDNGRFLPFWKNLSPVVYWLLPPLVGVPIIARTLLRHPLSRNYFTSKLNDQ